MEVNTGNQAGAIQAEIDQVKYYHNVKLQQKQNSVWFFNFALFRLGPVVPCDDATGFAESILFFHIQIGNIFEKKNATPNPKPNTTQIET